MVTGNDVTAWYQPTYYQPWTYTYTPSITLSLSEANYLRKMAQKNQELRKILLRFQPYIAVEVEL